MTFKLTPQQMAIDDWAKNNIGFGGALVVEASAGTGKSTTIVQVTNGFSPKLKWVMTSFGRFSVKDLKAKSIPEYADNIRSYNSFGYMAVRKAYPGVKFDEDKLFNILKPRMGDKDKYIIHSVKKLVDLVKNAAMLNATDDQMYDFCKEYDIDLKEEDFPDLKFRIFQLAQYGLKKSYEMVEFVDFTDQIWFPAVMDDVTMPPLDCVLADEFQDTNYAQGIIIAKALRSNSSLIGVGDKFQSIFAFRGADHTAMDRLITKFSADVLPLSISWRCSHAICSVVNAKFPHIQFEVPETARPGIERRIQLNKVMDEVQVGDIVVCRVNAPLVPVAFALIRRGIKATIQGRDIGKTIIVLIKKQKAFSVPELMQRLSSFRDKEADKLLQLDKLEKIVELDDKIATIDALSEGAGSVDEIIQRAEEIFSDDRGAILLSSIHRAKGLEGMNVFILRPDLLPHPRAKTPTAMQQEANLEYVAVTRGKDQLVWVDGKDMYE